jgi:integrase
MMEPRWDESNKRWECSLGSGKTRTWFRSKVQGEAGRQIVLNKREKHVTGPDPLRPGSLGEFIEAVWWPRTKPKCTLETQRVYKLTLEKHIYRFSGYLLTEMRLEVLQPWVSSIEASPKTVRNIYGIMSGILELAHKTNRYPCLDHRLVVLPTVVKVKRTGLEASNITKLVNASIGTPLEGPIWAAAYLGLRRNEVCGLKVPHIVVNKDGAVVTVQDNRQAHGETAKLKSKPEGQPRVLHIPKWMGEKLLSFKEEGSIYLFHADGKPIHPKRITNNMEAICKKAKIPIMRFHDLRHACRSNLSAAGVPEVVIMSILGHTDYQASLGYQDERAERQREAFGKLTSVQG